MIGEQTYKNRFSESLEELNQGLKNTDATLAYGKVRKKIGLTIEVTGLQLPIGSRCCISKQSNQKDHFIAEVIGFDNNKLYLMPLKVVENIEPGSLVKPIAVQDELQLSNHLLGRVINGLGQPIDQKPIESAATQHYPVSDVNPLLRKPVSEPLDVGVRCINSLLTMGKGQRVGLFAGSGVGKSVLIGMMTKFTKADVIVVGLVGERGREVNEFIHENLGEKGLKKSVVVASPADESPLLRMKAANTATLIAQYFRDQGKDVLLIMDSLTRFAHAHREIALAAGEVPATKGYPASVFAKIPDLIEKAGNGLPNKGTLTAIYTVLTEGDDLQDPVADTARAILDGHVVLSRKLAEQGLYPAIDVEASISRVMNQVVDDQHKQLAMIFKKLYARYEQSKDLIQVGAYVAGNDAETDIAIEKHDQMMAFISQNTDEPVDIQTANGQLLGIFSQDES